MYIFDAPARPDASFSCSRCRSVVVVEPQDLPDQTIVRLACPACQNAADIYVPYMRRRLVGLI